MKILEYQEMMDKDRRIDRANLEEEITKTPLLHGKYYHFLMTEMALYKKLDQEFRSLKKQKTEYYLGRSGDEVYQMTPLQLKLQRTDLETYLDADEEMQEQERRMYNQKSKIDLLQTFLTHVVNVRGFAFNNLIEIRKFENGVN